MTIVCINCGKEFFGRKRAKFCSQSCFGKHNGFSKTFSWKGLKHSEETKKKMSIASLGKHKSEEHRKNISIGKLGKYFSIEHRRNISIAKTGDTKISGENCWNWKGGISKIDKVCRRLPEYFQWRSDVFVRDNWTCRTCGITGVYVTAHHIKGFSKIIKENNIVCQDDARRCAELWDRNNGITLCEECHKLTDNYKGRGINKKNI